MAVPSLPVSSAARALIHQVQGSLPLFAAHSGENSTFDLPAGVRVPDEVRARRGDTRQKRQMDRLRAP
jgi:hypothetical protein